MFTCGCVAQNSGCTRVVWVSSPQSYYLWPSDDDDNDSRPLLLRPLSSDHERENSVRWKFKFPMLSLLRAFEAEACRCLAYYYRAVCALHTVAKFRTEGGWDTLPPRIPHRGWSKEGRRSWRGSSSTLLSDRTRRKGDVDYYAGQVVHRRAPLFFRLVRHELGDNVSYINVGQIIGPLAHSFAIIPLKRAAHTLFNPFRLYCSI